MKAKVLAALVLCLMLSQSFAADSSTTSYDDIAFPQWTKDLRRTEIITFGSLPFVTIWATVAYSGIQYGEFRNPLNKSSDGLSTDDQKRIMQIAATSCVALGLTDLAITLIRRAAKRHNSIKNRKPDIITITTLEKEAEEAEKDADFSRKKPHPAPNPAPVIPDDYLQGGIQNAIF